MQNIIKSKTRLAFIQFIFLSFSKNDNLKSLAEEFENYFYNLKVSSIEENVDKIIKFNKNFFNKLIDSYSMFLINNKNLEKLIDNLISFDRKFSNWDNINKSIILSILSEIEITPNNKIKIVLNDYLNISKSFISKKEQKMLNAIVDKYINEKKII